MAQRKTDVSPPTAKHNPISIAIRPTRFDIAAWIHHDLMARLEDSSGVFVGGPDSTEAQQQWAEERRFHDPVVSECVRYGVYTEGSVHGAEEYPRIGCVEAAVVVADNKSLPLWDAF